LHYLRKNGEPWNASGHGGLPSRGEYVQELPQTND
jgi:hypothetical protein